MCICVYEWVCACVRMCVPACLCTLLCVWLPAFSLSEFFYLCFTVSACFMYVSSVLFPNIFLHHHDDDDDDHHHHLTTTFSPAIFTCSVSGSFIRLLISECFLVCWTCFSFLEVFCHIFRFYFLVSLHMLQLHILSHILFIYRFESLFLFIDVFFFSFSSKH